MRSRTDNAPNEEVQTETPPCIVYVDDRTQHDSGLWKTLFPKSDPQWFRRYTGLTKQTGPNTGVGFEPMMDFAAGTAGETVTKDVAAAVLFVIDLVLETSEQKL